MSDLIKREDAIKAIHNYWKKRLDTLPTKESQCGEVYADIQQMDKILEHNKTLCNFINAIPSADRPQGEWIEHKWIEYNEELMLEIPMHNYECSKCHSILHEASGTYFCPNCGAKMKGADDE